MSLIRSFNPTFYLFQCVESTSGEGSGMQGVVWRARVLGDDSQAPHGRSMNQAT